MLEDTIYSRVVEPRLLEALQDSPVVLIHGPRQCGKSTLAREIGEKFAYAYFTFDDDVTRSSALSDPVGFVADLPERTILDEVQRIPELFTALKAAVDRKRSPGRFILTGSANALLVPRLADSLAGRMEILRLHPLSQSELAGRQSEFLDTLFGAGFKTRKLERLGLDLLALVVAGGYPAALARRNPRRRAIWYRDYIETLVQRDVRELARIRGLDVVPRILGVAASQTAQLFNVSELAGPFQLSRPTVQEYVTLLEKVFLLETLSPWHTNRLSRLVKTPKLHLGDTGVACALLGLDVESLRLDKTAFGPLLETFIYQELRKQANGHEDDFKFHHYRDRDGAEVDIVIERGSRQLVGVEVKAAATVMASDFRGLRKLKTAAGKRFMAGVVLYDGEDCASFGDGLYAVPIRMLWEKHNGNPNTR